MFKKGDVVSYLNYKFSGFNDCIGEFKISKSFFNQEYTFIMSAIEFERTKL